MNKLDESRLQLYRKRLFYKYNERISIVWETVDVQKTFMPERGQPVRKYVSERTGRPYIELATIVKPPIGAPQYVPYALTSMYEKEVQEFTDELLAAVKFMRNIIEADNEV